MIVTESKAILQKLMTTSSRSGASGDKTIASSQAGLSGSPSGSCRQGGAEAVFAIGVHIVAEQHYIDVG